MSAYDEMTIAERVKRGLCSSALLTNPLGCACYYQFEARRHYQRARAERRDGMAGSAHAFAESAAHYAKRARELMGINNDR